MRQTLFALASFLIVAAQLSASPCSKYCKTWNKDPQGCNNSEQGFFLLSHLKTLPAEHFANAIMVSPELKKNELGSIE